MLLLLLVAAPVSAQPTPPSPTQPVITTAKPPAWKERANWRLLKRGMPVADLKRLFGEPTRVDASVAITFWHYGRGAVHLDVDAQRVTGWAEPD